MKKMSQEQRRYKRVPAHGSLHIRTSVSDKGYTVSVRDISQDGIFIRSSQLPMAGEKISFHILNQRGEKHSTGQGQVVWVHGNGPKTELGFAIQLDQKLNMEEQKLLQGRKEEEKK